MLVIAFAAYLIYGGLHEFEDDLIARAAALLGVPAEEALAIRDRESGRT